MPMPMPMPLPRELMMQSMSRSRPIAIASRRRFKIGILCGIICVCTLICSWGIQVQVHAEDELIKGQGVASSMSMFSDFLLSYRIEAAETRKQYATTTTTTTTTNTDINTNTDTSTTTYKITYENGVGTQVQTAMMNGAIDFGVMESAFPVSQAAASPDVVMFPIFSSPIVLAYCLDKINTQAPPLIFNLQTLARIFRGNITKWNDPDIQATNPGVILPNQYITVVGQAGSAGGTNVLTRTFQKNDPDWFTATRTPAGYFGLSFPPNVTALFQGRLRMVSGYSTGVVNTIIQTPYSIGYLFMATAVQSGVSMATIINTAGTPVPPTSAAAALAATEVKPPINFYDLTSVLDISSPLGGQAYPFCTITVIAMNKRSTRTTCAAKSEMLRFITWIYTSPVAAQIASSNSYSVLPQLLQDQLDLVHQIEQIIKCASGNEAYSSASALVQTSYIGTCPILETVLDLYLNVQSRNSLIAPNLVFSPVPVNAVMAIQQTIAGELDAAFTTPEIVAADREFYYLMDQNHVSIEFIPAFITAVQPTFSLDPRIIAATGPTITKPLFPLVMDIDAYMNIYTGVIDSWLHPRLVELNPGLAQRFNATGLSPILRPQICCNNPTTTPVVTNRMMQSMTRTSFWYKMFSAQIFPLRLVSKIATFPNNASARYVIAEYEDNMAALSTGIYNSISYKPVTAFTSDPTSEFRMLPSSLNNAVGIDYVAKSLTPTADTLLNCARDTFDPKTLDLKLSLSNRDDCWPLSHTAQAVIPSSYSGASCSMGNNTLALIQWLLETDSLTESVNTNGAVRVTDLEDVDAAVIKVLHNIRCDGETMLITLPIIWSLAPGISSFAYAAAAIGWTLIIATYMFMMVKRGTTVFRSASVPSMTLILAGISILLAGAVALVQSPTTESCGAVLWLGSLGFTLTFAPLFMKTWRIYKIFDRKALHVIKISNKKLNFLIGVLVAFDLLILAIWQSTHPLSPVIVSQVVNSRIHQSTQCQAPDGAMPLMVITVVTKSILILFGALMGFTTRKVATTFNESQTVAWAIYNFIFSTGIIIPIMIIVKAVEDSYVLLQLFLVLWIAYATLSLLFGPKITHIIFGDEAATQAENSSSRISSNGFSFISAVGLSRQVLAKYIQALEIQLQTAKTRMREMVGHTASGMSAPNKNSSMNNDSGLNSNISGLRDSPAAASGSGTKSYGFSNPAEKYQSTGLTTTKSPINSTTKSVSSTSSSNNARRPSGVQMAPARAVTPTHDTIVGASAPAAAVAGSASPVGTAPSSRAQCKNDVRVSPTFQATSLNSNNNNNTTISGVSSASATITAALTRSHSQAAASVNNVNVTHPNPNPSARARVPSGSISASSSVNEEEINLVQPLHPNGRSSSISFIDDGIDKSRDSHTK